MAKDREILNKFQKNVDQIQFELRNCPNQKRQQLTLP